jgi:RNA ligase
MNISDFKGLQNEPMIKFKEEEVDGEQLTICSYMISTNDLWEIPLAKECRGITFDSTGNVVCRPFEKFFNMGERPETQIGVVRNWNWNDVVVLEKRDGSMVSPIVVNGKVFWKTKKSFYSDVAVNCQKFADEYNNTTNGRFYEAVKSIANDSLTLIFEFTSPDSKIVLDYGQEPRLVLLAVRENNDGWYHDPMFYAKQLGVDSIPVWNKTLDEIFLDVKLKINFEGYVLFNRYTQERVKVKTDWYLLHHRLRTELRGRDVVKLILDETLDDLKSTIVDEGLSLDPILDIEHQVTKDFDQIIESTKELANVGKQLERKEFALLHHRHPYFGLAIKEIEGKDPDFKKFFEKYMLMKYSLRNVYSNFKKDSQ